MTDGTHEDRVVDIESLKEVIKIKRENIKRDKEYIIKAEQEIAEYLCPFEIGEKVINPKGEEEIIASISYISYKPWYSFKIFRIRNNGESYSRSQYSYNQDKYTKTTKTD